MDSKASGDAAWARRTLAVALAGAGDQRRSAEAQQLINIKSDDPADRRAQARVLATLPLKGQRARAVQILEELALKQTLPVDDQLLLAQLYHADGPWQKAREILQRLTAQGNHAPSLLLFARGLLQNRELPEAERCIDRLEKLEKDKRIPGGTAIELRLILLEARGQADKALLLAQQYAAANEKRPQPFLVWLATLMRQKRYSDVLAIWERKKNDVQPELVSGAAVASLRASQATPETCAPVAEWLEAVIEKKPKSLSLLLQLADVQDYLGRYGEAEKLYRKALALDGENIVALNNLAGCSPNGPARRKRRWP
jgi:tetratricopeptide (TPR) repeat protein